MFIADGYLVLLSALIFDLWKSILQGYGHARKELSAAGRTGGFFIMVMSCVIIKLISMWLNMLLLKASLMLIGSIKPIKACWQI